MREIEIKARVKNKEAVISKLAELGCVLGDELEQRDVVYARNSNSMQEFLANDLFLRVRKTPAETIFTLKYHPNRTENGSPLSMPLEHEVSVSSASEIEAMLALLGFTPATETNKVRRTAHFNDWEICLDEVESLGSFIEVESLVDHDTEVGPISEKLTAFIVSLGVLPEDIGVKRYDIQLLEKRFSGV